MFAFGAPFPLPPANTRPMRFGILSDIHSNLEALNAVLPALDAQGLDELVCLGDVVGYGADPAACVDLIRARCRVCIMGNHDAAVAQKMDYQYYYDAARNVLEWTRAALSPDQLEWLRALPLTDERDAHDVCFTHGEPVAPEAYNYVYTTDQAAMLLPHYDKLKRVTFVGHSHLRRVYALEEGRRVRDLSGRQEIDVSAPDTKYIVAVGSVGQPRDYDTRAGYAVFDTDKMHVSLRRVTYPVGKAAEKILEAGLPESFAFRLFNGI